MISNRKNYNKKISDTCVRLGEVRFSYCHLFAPYARSEEDKKKYSMQLLIPKADAVAKKLIDDAIDSAKQTGMTSKWGGKMPPASKLTLPLRDGDEEYPDDENYAGMFFMNVSTSADHKPGVLVLEDGVRREALDDEDVYSGCWGAVVIGFFPYDSNGNKGVSAGLNNVIKTADDESLAGGGRSAEVDFGDM